MDEAAADRAFTETSVAVLLVSPNTVKMETMSAFEGNHHLVPLEVLKADGASMFVAGIYQVYWVIIGRLALSFMCRESLAFSLSFLCFVPASYRQLGITNVS